MSEEVKTDWARLSWRASLGRNGVPDEQRRTETNSENSLTRRKRKHDAVGRGTQYFLSRRDEERKKKKRNDEEEKRE